MAADGGVGFELGLTSVIQMFEQRFGRRATTCVIGLMVVALSLFCLQVIVGALSPPAVWVWTTIQSFGLPIISKLKTLSPFWQDTLTRASSLIAVTLSVLFAKAVLASGRQAVEAQRQVDNALLTGGDDPPNVASASAAPPPASPTPGMDRISQARRSLADGYAERFLQPGYKRLVEIRNRELTRAQKQESAARLRDLSDAVRLELRRDFGLSVELRFNFGKPYMRLGQSVVDDYEAKWIELRDIVRDIRNGSLEQ